MKDRTIRPAKRNIARLGFVLLAGTATLGVYGFNRAFARAGESAISLVPETALGVAVWDFQPSPSQLMLFRHILGSTSDAPMETMWSMVGDPKLGKALGESASRSGLVAMTGLKDGFALIKISDEAKFSSLLGQKLSSEPTLIGNTPWYGALSHGYLVCGPSSATVASELTLMSNPPSTSFASLPQFRDARSSVDKNAHVMVFVNGGKGFEKALAENADMTEQQRKQVLKFKGMGCFAVTLGDQGLLMEGSAELLDDMKGLDKLAPLPTSLSPKIPGHPMGFIAANGLETYVKQALGDKNMAEYVNKPFGPNDEFTFSRDVAPLLKGTVTAAIYDVKGNSPSVVVRVDGPDQEASHHGVTVFNALTQESTRHGTWNTTENSGVYTDGANPKGGYFIDPQGFTLALGDEYCDKQTLTVLTPSPLLENWRSQVLPEAVSVVALDPRAIASYFINHKMGSQADVHKIGDLFETGQPMVFSSGYRSGKTVFRGYIPINWDKLDQVVQKMRESTHPAEQIN